MKLCSISCILAIIIILSNIVMTLLMGVNPTMNKYEEQLPPELKIKYQKIAEERRKIYMWGHIWGAVLGALVLLTLSLYKVKYFSGLSQLCLWVIIIFFFSTAYYVFSPKTSWMLEHIQDENQAKAWLEMYKYMKNTYHSSFVISLMGMGVFLLAFGCNKYSL